MVAPLIATKLNVPRLRPDTVIRQRLIGLLDQGLHRKLTLISGSTGYGKTTLVSDWLSKCDRQVAWLSLDERDNDIASFLSYLVAALRNHISFHEWHVTDLLQSPQSPPLPSIISVLINDISRLAIPIVLVLDDYHVIHSKSIHDAVSMLLEHMPSNLHIVILTREEPELYLTTMRVKNEVNDIGVMDLRFNDEEIASYLNDMMKLNLSMESVAMLEKRTEGWIAGLQMAALSMQDDQQAEHSEPMPPLSLVNQHVLLDYLFNEVLLRQTESMQKFLLYTSILDRFCGSLCDAVMLEQSSVSGEEVLLKLENANLFIVALDNEQQWYRYHHLFAELLTRQLQKRARLGELEDVALMHHRASVWYEKNGLNLEAFRHAVAANDIERAARLVEGNGMPLHLQGEVTPVLNWLESLPEKELNARPSLWVMYASALLMAGRPTEVESKLLAAEAALAVINMDASVNNLLGIIATTRAAVAAIASSGPPELRLIVAEDELLSTDSIDKTNELVGQIVPAHNKNKRDNHQVDIVIAQCGLALKYLDSSLLPVRITALWLLGDAHQHRNNLVEAKQAFIEVLTVSRKIGGNIIEVQAYVGLGNLEEQEGQLHSAEQYYSRALLEHGDKPLAAICEAYIGLARISYAWDDQESSMKYVQKSLQLAKQADNKDMIVSCKLMIARITLLQQGASDAMDYIDAIKKYVRAHRLLNRLADIEEFEKIALLYKRNVPDYIEPLTTRELEVLQLIALGYSNQEIGDRLYLALDTVKGHNRRIFAKLHVERRTEAVATARKLGWIE